MAPARSLTALYEGFLVTPRPGPHVCPTCFNLTGSYDRCLPCSRQEAVLAGVLPISYSVGHEGLHAALAGYKRVDGPGARVLGIELAAVLWRFLARHEACLASSTGVERFDVVTTVPSSDAVRDLAHPLPWIVGELCAATRRRYQHLLHRSRVAICDREFSEAKYLTSQDLRGEDVLVIDDTWTTGASAQSAAAALRAAGCGTVAAVVIGRHINRDWGPNDQELAALPPFDWDRCALCGCNRSGQWAGNASTHRLVSKATAP
jgi:predicted amidophosphoribosyltransferase